MSDRDVLEKPKEQLFCFDPKSPSSIENQCMSRIRELENEKIKLERVLDTVNEGMITIGADEKILSINAYAKSFFSIEANPLGILFTEFVKSKQLYEIYKEALQTKKEVDHTIDVTNPSKKTLRVKSFRVKTSKESSPVVLMVFEDITNSQKLEKFRSNFVANVSHELRTPLTSIQGAIETIDAGDLKDEETLNKFLAIINRQSKRLVDLIENVLSLAKIEELEEYQELDAKEESLSKCIENSIKNVAVLAEKKQIKIESQLDKALSANMDAELLERAITSYIENAIKYSPIESMVTVKLSNREKEIYISVIDNGPGIEKKHQNRIFERFYRIDKGRSREVGGTGLGLAIVKHIAQLHGGKAQVLSEPGKGSEFMIVLPTNNLNSG